MSRDQKDGWHSLLLNNFENVNWRGDLFGGVTTAIVSLPLALAFGVASGAGPQAGLWGAILVGLFAALFGGSSRLISEPTGPMTVIMTAVITAMMAKHPEGGMALAFTVVMMAGLFQVLLGSLRLGRYITLMPYSVISGFMSGIGIILILLQIAPLLGQPTPPGGVIGTLKALPDLVRQASGKEFLLGAATVAILFTIPKGWRRYAPPQLLALLIVTGASIALFASDEVRRIGVIPTGLPSFQFPTFTAELMTTMVLDSMILGTLGCIDTLLTAMIADSLTREEHRSDKELVGQGIANCLSGFCGGLPGAGATMGTVVNVQVGARSPMAGLVRAILLLVVVMVAAGLTEPIPLAVLAGIALHVGINILDWSFMSRIHRVALSPTFIMYGVMVLTVFVDLIVAVGVGVFIANIITIERLSRIQEENVRAISDTNDEAPLTEQEGQLLDRARGQVLFFYLSGPMIFGVSKAIARQHAAVARFRVMILDLSDVPMIDTTVCLALENAVKDAVEAGCRPLLVCPHKESRARLENFGLLEIVNTDQIKQTRLEALQEAVTVVEGYEQP